MAPLHYAAYENDPDVVRMLIEAGADHAARDTHPTVPAFGGSTPLFLCALQGCAAAAAALLAGGADVNLRGGANVPPLITAIVCSPQVPALWQMMITANADLEQVAPHTAMQRYRGMRALHAAIVSGNLTATRTLLEAGADVAARIEACGGPAAFEGKDAWALAASEGAAFVDVLRQTRAGHAGEA